MSQDPPPYPSDPPASPSFVQPVALTAFATAAMFCLPAALGGDTAMCCLQNCCAATVAAILGFAPVMFFHRTGGRASAGEGCLIAFLGVGIGGLVGAIVQAKFPAYDPDEVRKGINQAYEDMVRQMEQQGQPFEVTREDFVSIGMSMLPCLVILVVASSAIIAGFFGMIAGSMLGRRNRQPPQWPPPQQPT